ncbi:MAG: hypothetical protein ACXVFA_05370 [Solirubrobacteraceae bacterium]
MTDFTQLPPDMPVPKDDGAADHLPGRQVPDVTLAATSGEAVAPARLGPGRTIIYIYPMTGRPRGRSAHRLGRHPGRPRAHHGGL